MKQDTIGLLGGYCTGNLGDDAILESILVLLRRAGHQGKIMVYCHDPSPLPRQEGLAAGPMRRWNFPAMVKEARKLRGLIIGGGGLLFDYDPFIPTKFLLRALAARLAGRRVMLCAVGVGPLRTRMGRLQTRAIASLSDILSVRDPQSAQILRRLGVRRPIHVVADPAFLLEPPPARAASGEAVWAVRRWPPLGEILPWLPGQLAAAADSFCSRLNLRVALVPFYAGYDEPFCARVRSLMRMSDHASALPRPASAAAALQIVAASPVVLSMRLHGVIFAALAGTPCVAIACDEKLRIAMQSLELDRFALPLHAEMPPDLVALTCERAVEEQTQRRAEIAERVQYMRQQAARSQELLRQFLELCGRGQPW
jgi:polysaccharide pyruvyl transferase CsaB